MMWELMGMVMVQHAALRRCPAWFWRTIGPFRISGQPSASPATSRITRLTDSRVLGRSFSNCIFRYSTDQRPSADFVRD